MLMLYLSALDTGEEKSDFEKLYLEYRQTMYAVAFGILKNEQDAEDAVHAAFLNIAKYYKKVKRIRPENLKAYLVIVVKNTSVNLYRKNENTREHEDSFTDLKETIDYLERLEYAQLLKIISSLPESSREIMFLFFVEGFNVREIADMLNITQNAVYKRLGRAKKLLREALRKDGGYAGNKI